MNNSFARLIDGMNATLRSEVLPRLDDEFARGQVFGVINLLNTFKARADWSTGFLLQQIEAQHQALATASTLLSATPGAPLQPLDDLPVATPVAELLARRDDGNRRIGVLLSWLGDKGESGRAALLPELVQGVEQALRQAMRAEVDIELKHSPRPLFAEMSGGG